MRGVGRRGFLGLLAAAPFAANDLAEHAEHGAFFDSLGGDFPAFAGETMTRTAGRVLEAAPEAEWIAESADMLKHFASFGG